MRKAWYTLLIFLAVGLIGFSVALFVIHGSREAVTWQEETLYGDKSAVEGIRVKASNHVRNHLLWETEGTLGGELNPETKFTFSNDSIHAESEIIFRGLTMGANMEFLADISFNGHDVLFPYVQEKYADLIAYCEACHDSVPVGSEKEFTVDLAEYMDYYSFSGYLDFPDIGWFMLNEFDHYSGAETHLTSDFTEAIHDFFRIPIMGEFKLNFSINRRQNGGSFGTSFAGGPDGEPYRPYFDAVYMKDTCYLTFNTVAPNGEIADTSLIPGGYGLYRLNVRSDGSGNLDWDSPIAEMVFPMDPGEEFSYLEKSDDEKHIYIHTWQGNKLMRTILDESTMEVLQRFELLEEQENFYWEVKECDDFLVVLQFSINNLESEKNTVAVFAEDEMGLYHHQFTVPMSPETVDVNDDLLIYSSVTEQFHYDGNQLYVIQNEYRDTKYGYARGDSCNFFILTYEPEGLSYIGKYHVNLAQIHPDDENAYGTILPWSETPVSFLSN